MFKSNIRLREVLLYIDHWKCTINTNVLYNNCFLYSSSPNNRPYLFLGKIFLLNIVGKGVFAGSEQFLQFQNVFNDHLQVGT